MGWPPSEVKRTSVWDFWAAWAGFYEFHAGEDKTVEPMSHAELHQLLERHGHGR